MALRYARVAGISTDVLIDDQLDLPEGVPLTTMSKPVRGLSGVKNKQGRK
jgi:hypothetical protein